MTGHNLYDLIVNEMERQSVIYSPVTVTQILVYIPMVDDTLEELKKNIARIIKREFP